jgi:hypothetical protein
MKYERRKAIGAAMVFFVGATSMWAKSRTIEDYPLRVEIIDVEWTPSNGSWNGVGHGNLVSPGGGLNGIEFSASCRVRFMTSVGNTAYPARWKKERASLALRETEVGNENKHEECEVKVSLRDFLYRYRNGQLETVTQAQLQAAARQKQEAAAQAEQAKAADLDPTHYPLRFKLLKGDWTAANPGFDGFGRGDLFGPDKSVKGIEFSSHGRFRLSESLGGDSYRARLNETQDKLLLLVHVVGEHGGDSWRQCELKIDVKPYVFVMKDGQLTTLTQEQYAQMIKAREQKASVSVTSTANPQ